MTPVLSRTFFDVLAVVGQYLVAAYLGVRSVVVCRAFGVRSDVSNAGPSGPALYP
jgi:hypothetical protein